MNLLLFIDNLGAGGAQRQLAGLAVLLRKSGYSVKVCTYHRADFYKSYLDDNHIPNELIPNAENGKKRIFAVKSYLKKEHPDCVISYLETPSLVACLAKLFGGHFRLIVSERNTTQKIGINERVRFFLYHWADVVVPNSYSQEKWLSDHYPWMKRRITTITNFVDLDKFAYTNHTRNEIPVIMVAASIWASKNAPGLIEAAKLMKERGTRFKIKWYGKSDKWIDYFNQCQNLISTYGLNDVFELLPKTKEIEIKYQEADYFCLPSFYEGTPNVICEAISSGLPVICSNVCDNSHYVFEGKNGALFDPMNPMDLANKILNVISQTDEEYQSYRKESRFIAEQLLDQDVFVNKYIKIIDQ